MLEQLREDVEETKKKERMGIEDQDFWVEFSRKEWMIEWVWKGEPLTLTNKVACYKSSLKETAREGQMDWRGYTHAMERGGRSGSFVVDGCTTTNKRQSQISAGLPQTKPTCRMPYRRWCDRHTRWDDEGVEINRWSVQNSAFEIHLFAASCEQQTLEVPVSHVQRKDLLSHEVEIQTKLGIQNHVNDPEKNTRWDEERWQCEVLYWWHPCKWDYGDSKRGGSPS